MDLKVSPLQMALVAAAISNDGIQPPPALINSYLSPDGKWIEISQEHSESAVMSRSIAKRVQSELAMSNQAIWFQSAHATIHEDQPLTWLIGGTTSEWTGTPLAIAIAVEENAPDLAQAVGGILLNYLNSD
jgi:cell division protein FtsI/penicillin-binding protein 2